MKTTPKMLPWLARSAGVSDRRAEQLWWEASRYARKAINEFDTPKYWRVALDRFLNLLQTEAQSISATDASPGMVAQSHLRAGLLVLTEFFAEVSANLRTWFARNFWHAA